MGVPGLMTVTDKKKNVYVVENGAPPPQTDFAPAGGGRHHMTTRSSAKAVAYFELISSVVFWFPVLDVIDYISFFIDLLFDRSTVYWTVEDPQEASAAVAVFLRFLASVLLLIGTYKNRSWMAVPYLLIQMFLLFGGPFMFLYSSLGYVSQYVSSRTQLEMILILLFVCVFIWGEFVKWRTVYNFYDSLTCKRISEDFAKLIENETASNDNRGREAAKTETEWYMKQVYQSATMQEIDPKEVESLVPLQKPEESSKEFSFQNAKLELKE